MLLFSIMHIAVEVSVVTMRIESNILIPLILAKHMSGVSHFLTLLFSYIGRDSQCWLLSFQ